MANMSPTGLDAHKPDQIAELVEAAGVTKAKQAFTPLVTLAFLAGVFIALGAVAYTAVMTGVDTGFGPARFLGGVVFSLGLILVIVGGAELFTGNALMVMAAVDRKITSMQVARNWVIVYLGNFAGSLMIVVLVWLSGIIDGAVAETAGKFAVSKTSLPWQEAFFRGVLCNMLVCLAVWLTLAARTVAGKIMAIVWPIATFVMLGLEHSIANMYLIPQGMVAGAHVTIAGFAHNLFFVTLGNIVGGAGGVALAYRLAYGPK